MWVVIYGRHWVYVQYKEFRYETPLFLVALVVYWFHHCRYSFSAYPVKYVKIYKVDKNVINFDSYSRSFSIRPRGKK